MLFTQKDYSKISTDFLTQINLIVILQITLAIFSVIFIFALSEVYRRPHFDAENDVIIIRYIKLSRNTTKCYLTLTK